MYVTECSVGSRCLAPDVARDKMIESKNENAVFQLRAIAGLCNSADFDTAQAEVPFYERKINGDATDQAILRFSESLGPVSELKRYWKTTFEVAFNSKNKFMIRVLSLLDSQGLALALNSDEASRFQAQDL